ncbi:hypothetical protein ASG39_09740 [Rhizobium sp. Leaf371]|uniref:hypothetical protein n=1 Tax=Rhizobium sp. Leaf371 TaxID=1736355 RepID=UPI00071506D4|nr:hypothetical protein [Rhizobium sp. Leaf371]KQS65491.1 hypothetical protein ASG39_09740 [Rhizobium sp. Leaf371]
MPRTDFVADLRDLDNLIAYIIKDDLGKIYESLSALDRPIRKIENVEDFNEMGAGSPADKAGLLLLQIVPTVGEKWCHLKDNKVNFDGRQGVRTSILGYPLIQLYLGGVVVGSNSILKSTLGVGTAAGYKKRAVSEADIQTIESVDWKGVKETYNTIVKFIKANADGKTADDAFILSGARTLLNSGYNPVSAF